MPDRENVTKALEKALSASKAVDSGFIWITVGEGRKALELLKEQNQIVRCRSCRYYNTECCADGFGWCHLRDFGTNDEWYCADGEVGTYAAD